MYAGRFLDLCSQLESGNSDPLCPPLPAARLVSSERRKTGNTAPVHAPQATPLSLHTKQLSSHGLHLLQGWLQPDHLGGCRAPAVRGSAERWFGGGPAGAQFTPTTLLPRYPPCLSHTYSWRLHLLHSHMASLPTARPPTARPLPTARRLLPNQNLYNWRQR